MIVHQSDMLGLVLVDRNTVTVGPGDGGLGTAGSSWLRVLGLRMLLLAWLRSLQSSVCSGPSSSAQLSRQHPALLT